MKKGLISIFLHGVTTSLRGMGLTFIHLYKAKKSRKVHDIRKENYFTEKEGITTLKYPYSAIPAPDNGRYQLYNEIEDCIVCDKCAKICPVDCIDIEPIKSAEEFGKTSDGTSKRIYAAKFDIDMAKCCYCGLCTTVCPTECLTMTDEYDFSVFELSKLNFGFGNLTEEEAEQKRKEWEENQAKKKKETSPEPESKPEAQKPQPAFRPKMPSAVKNPPPNQVKEEPGENVSPSPPEAKTGFQPRMRPTAINQKTEKEEKEKTNLEENKSENEVKPVFQPKMRPVIKPNPPKEND